MKLKSIILPVFLLLAAVCSCMKQQTENYYAKQEEAIDKFAQRLSPIRTVYNDGSVRIVVKETNPTADSLRKDGVVSFYYGGYLLSSSGSLNNRVFSPPIPRNWQKAPSGSFPIRPYSGSRPSSWTSRTSSTA